MRLNREIDPKVVLAIEEDMDQLDNVPIKSRPTTTKSVQRVPCDCSGGPGKNKTPEIRGTGLIDDNTLCPKCHGEGTISVILG